MRLRIALFFLFLSGGVFNSVLFAQNLVPNFDFETVTATPSTENQLNLASPWLPLNATPDLYYRNQNSSVPCNNIGIPLNGGGYCDDRSGLNAYAGIRVDLTSNYREYICVPLNVPLIAGDIYRIQFYVQRADSSRYSFSKMGALLTNNIPIQTGTGPLLFPPALEWTANVTDTINWTFITGLYQATGGENYLTIGLFRGDGDPNVAVTDFGPSFSGCSNYDNSAYYYIDEVSVRPLNELVQIGGDTAICPGQSATMLAISNVPFWWSAASAPNDTLSTNLLFTVTPGVPTKYYLNGLTLKDSVTVTIFNPPFVNLGPDTAVCRDDSIIARAYDPTAISYLWSNDSISDTIVIKEPGVYYVDVSNIGCTVSDTLIVGGPLDNPPLSLGEDSVYCFFYNDTLYLDAGPALSYTWLPTLQTTRSITVLQPDTYYVDIIRENGCRRRASLEVFEACEPLVWIPNAFTPDGDGLNDNIGAYINNVDRYSLTIVNRFGQRVFYTDVPGETWDGKFEGGDAPMGIYVYRLNYYGLDVEGSKFTGKQLGKITLIR
jgi:gliding motility-associated-like protein